MSQVCLHVQHDWQRIDFKPYYMGLNVISNIVISFKAIVSWLLIIRSCHYVIVLFERIKTFRCFSFSTHAYLSMIKIKHYTSLRLTLNLEFVCYKLNTLNIIWIVCICSMLMELLLIKYATNKLNSHRLQFCKKRSYIRDLYKYVCIDPWLYIILMIFYHRA